MISSFALLSFMLLCLSATIYRMTFSSSTDSMKVQDNESYEMHYCLRHIFLDLRPSSTFSPRPKPSWNINLNHNPKPILNPNPNSNPIPNPNPNPIPIPNPNPNPNRYNKANPNNNPNASPNPISIFQHTSSYI